ncbi:MAG: peptide chain release factor 1 [Deltaproteobacteria bacterium]|jgi:peptide chain release factor 1|nr:peptide chain release factor 1 [Deltaproteobacteria bacterium]
MFENAATSEQFLKIEEKRAALEEELNKPELAKSPRDYARVAKQHRELRRISEVWKAIRRIDGESEGAKELANDPDREIREMALSDLENLRERRKLLEDELELLLLPKDPDDDKNTIVEIRAGTGGDEAAIFAGDLHRMYMRYAERKGWKTELLTLNAGEGAGFKEAAIMVAGDKVHGLLKHESGVHRVQRVPETESQGRIHTSAATVAVLPEADEVDVEIKQEDVRIDVFRSSGPGGQNVNKTSSAVRITHAPSGLVVICQDEKSQSKNKQRAMTVLRARLYDAKNREARDKISGERREQVGSGDRSERIRTYNYPQGRVTDHRLNLTLYRLPSIMDGDLDEIVNALGTHFRAKSLSQSGT